MLAGECAGEAFLLILSSLWEGEGWPYFSIGLPTNRDWSVCDMVSARDIRPEHITLNRLSPHKIVEMAVAGGLLLGVYVFFGTLEQLWMDWNNPSIDRTYNMAIPVFSAIFVALKWRRLRTMPIRATLWGLPLVFLGVGMRLLAEPGQVDFLKYCSLVVLFAGLIWSLLGTKMFRELLFPICFLLFMVPVPDPVYQRMSVPMQNLAAKAGFYISKLLGVRATLSGRQLTITALDPPLPLAVADACSGMKSLLTLVAVAVAFAYITRRDLPTRIFISLSAVPIAIIMNMLRVAGVGVLAIHFGREAATGFTHWAQGIVFYIVEIALLFMEGALISWIFGKPAVEITRAAPRDNPGEAEFPCTARFSTAGIACMAIMALFVPVLYLYNGQVGYLTRGLEPKIPLEQFAHGEETRAPDARENEKELSRTDMELRIEEDGVQYIGFEREVRIDVLKAAEVDAHVNVRYYECKLDTKPEDIPKHDQNCVLAYVAFHKSASKGINRGAIHYPDQCYPGGGYNTAETAVVKIKTPGYCGGETEMAKSIFYNDRGVWLLVYYHMNNNGRDVVDRSAGKIDNFWKLLLGQRTGYLAQVQFSTTIGAGSPWPGGIDEEKIRKAEEHLQRFCPVFLEKLNRHLPDPVK